MPNSSINYEQFLINCIEEFVDHVRYSNGFIFGLLKDVTIGKDAVIEIDQIKIRLNATKQNGYHLNINTADQFTLPSFKTTGDDLRNIVYGVYTLDKAMSENKVFAKGPLEDLLGIYRLAIGLLIEGPTDPNLRKIWDKFNQDWIASSDPQSFPSLDNQQVYNYFPFQSIPEEVAMINISI